MPQYEYRALKAGGGTTKGLLTADTPRDARDKLRAMRLHPTRLDRVGTSGVKSSEGKSDRSRSLPNPFRRRHTREVILVTRQLATLLKSGIPLAEGLRAIIDEMDIPPLERVLRQIREEVTAGTSLADAMAKHPRYFGDLYVNMVRAGEASGALDPVLKRIAEFTEAQHRLRAKLISTMIYPAIMVVVAGFVMMFLMIAVIPSLEQMFASMNQELPLLTKINIGTSRFIRGSWYWILLAGGGLGWGIHHLLRRTKGGKAWTDRKGLDLPLFGPLLKKHYIARFAHTLSTLLSSGVTVVESLVIVRRLIGNTRVAETVDAVRQRIIEGADIATPLRQCGVFPSVVAYMISIGEESGDLENVLTDLSSSMEEEIETATQRFTSMLEPAMIVMMAVIVGGIVMSIVLPILQMTQGIK